MASSPAYRPFGAFRFLLAMMVLVQHSLLLLPPGGAHDLFYGLELGAVAVAVFFALSGFIVAEACASFYAGRPAAFLANRALRVAPPYLATLALAVGVDSWLFGAGRLVPLDAPLHGAPWQPRVLLAGLLEIVPGLPAHRISLQYFSFIPFAWTLRLEVAFYLLAAGVAWLTARAPARQGRIVAVAFAGLYAGFALFLMTKGSVGGRQLLNAPFFAFGVGLFLLRRHPTWALTANLLAIFACVPIAFILCGERGHPVLELQLPMLGLLFAALAYLSAAPAPIWRGWDKRLGELSYPLYIGHGIVLTLLASLSNQRGLLPYTEGIVGALCLAALLHAWVERPLRRVRDRVRGTKV
jgi:peptidoglycan/LPS O-acetylase OafA/YrhL